MISNMTKCFAEKNIVDLISYIYQEIYDGLKMQVFKQKGSSSVKKKKILLRDSIKLESIQSGEVGGSSLSCLNKYKLFSIILHNVNMSFTKSPLFQSFTTKINLLNNFFLLCLVHQVQKQSFKFFEVFHFRKKSITDQIEEKKIH